MKPTTEHWVALRSYRLKWLWWLSKVLVEAQGNPTHLLFLSPLSTNAAVALLHYIFTLDASLSFLLFLLFSPHKSLILPHSFSLLLPSLPSFSFWGAHIISVEPWFTFLLPLSPSVFLPSKQSKRGPFLHLLFSYLLVVPSVSIRADCCHFRAVCPCISFCVVFFSFLDTVPSVFFYPSFSWRTDNHHYSVGKKRKRSRSSGMGFAL